MVTSFFPGRIRLRSAAFKDAELLKRAEAVLRSSPELSEALKSVQGNPRTGSVLLEYDAEKISFEENAAASELLDFLKRLEGEAKNYDGSQKKCILSLLDEVEKKLSSPSAFSPR